MNKKTVVIISLVLSVFSLFWVGLGLFGLDRYFTLHFGSCDDKLKNYGKVQHADKEKNKVVVAFETDSARIKNSNPFLSSILDQTKRVDEIIMFIPYADMKSIPENIKKVVNVFGYSENFQDKTCLIYSLIKEHDANTKIIVLQGDTIYGKTFIESIVDESNKRPHTVILAKNATLVLNDMFSPQDIDNRCNSISNMPKFIMDYRENYVKF